MPLKWMFKGNNYAETEWMTWKPSIPWKQLKIMLSQRNLRFLKEEGLLRRLTTMKASVVEY